MFYFTVIANPPSKSSRSEGPGASKATPHNGKPEDFQLFLALLDSDRFEGKFRDGGRSADASDLMRRLVKEQLLKRKPDFGVESVNYSPADLVVRGEAPA